MQQDISSLFKYSVSPPILRCNFRNTQRSDRLRTPPHSNLWLVEGIFKMHGATDDLSAFPSVLCTGSPQDFSRRLISVQCCPQ